MKRTFHDLQLSPEDLEARPGQVSVQTASSCGSKYSEHWVVFQNPLQLELSRC